MQQRRGFGTALALALASLAIAAPAVARDDGRDHRRGHAAHGHHDRGWDRDRRYGYDRRDDRRHDRRYDRRHDRRDRHVAYAYPRRPVVYHAPPRGHYFAPPPWSRGRYVHHYQRPVYVVRDYRGYGLRHPPRGYHWMRDDYGDYLLVAIASGLIADLVLHR